MKFYRLTETDTRYGMTGNVIPYETYTRMKYADKSLFMPVDGQGTGYPYKMEIAAAGHTPVLYYIDDYADIVAIIDSLANRAGIPKSHAPIYIPKSSVTKDFAGYSITIRYRKQWEQQDLSSSSIKDTP